jgi:hypothetical protein
MINCRRLGEGFIGQKTKNGAKKTSVKEADFDGIPTARLPLAYNM